MAEQRARTLSEVVGSLCDASNDPDGPIMRSGRRQELPSRDVVQRVVEDLRSVLFPGYYGTSEMSAESMRFHVGSTLDGALSDLRRQIKRGMCFTCEQEDPARCPDCEARATSRTEQFLDRLPALRAMLATDVRAAFEGDPAATSREEAIFCYPGIVAITSYRLAHALHDLEVPLIPRMITEQAHSATGIDIHPGATIGESFFIDHGTGVVVGETCRIGRRVRVYQGVTLGAKSLPLDGDGKPIKGVERHPIVEDDVIIYSGATILGRVVIGRGSVIGGNVWVTRDVAPGSRITQAQARQDLFVEGAGI